MAILRRLVVSSWLLAMALPLGLFASVTSALAFTILSVRAVVVSITVTVQVARSCSEWSWSWFWSTPSLPPTPRGPGDLVVLPPSLPAPRIPLLTTTAPETSTAVDLEQAPEARITLLPDSSSTTSTSSSRTATPSPDEETTSSHRRRNRRIGFEDAMPGSQHASRNETTDDGAGPSQRTPASPNVLLLRLQTATHSSPSFPPGTVETRTSIAETIGLGSLHSALERTSAPPPSESTRRRPNHSHSRSLPNLAPSKRRQPFPSSQFQRSLRRPVVPFRIASMSSSSMSSVTSVSSSPTSPVGPNMDPFSVAASAAGHNSGSSSSGGSSHHDFNRPRRTRPLENGHRHFAQPPRQFPSGILGPSPAISPTSSPHPASVLRAARTPLTRSQTRPVAQNVGSTDTIRVNTDRAAAFFPPLVGGAATASATLMTHPHDGYFSSRPPTQLEVLLAQTFSFSPSSASSHSSRAHHQHGHRRHYRRATVGSSNSAASNFGSYSATVFSPGATPTTSTTASSYSSSSGPVNSASSARPCVDADPAANFFRDLGRNMTLAAAAAAFARTPGSMVSFEFAGSSSSGSSEQARQGHKSSWRPKMVPSVRRLRTARDSRSFRSATMAEPSTGRSITKDVEPEGEDDGDAGDEGQRYAVDNSPSSSTAETSPLTRPGSDGSAKKADSIVGDVREGKALAERQG